MNFGLFTIVPWHESSTQEQSLREALEQIELADQLGLDEVWLGEHRFSRHWLLPPSPVHQLSPLGPRLGE